VQREEAQRLIQQGEGQQIEFKASFSESREAIETLCAFTHADGGTVFFGVRDDGTIVGVQLGKKTLEDFANQVRSNTQSPLTPRIYKYAIDGM
jgi:predicted HTH transcriptional regulator